MAVHGTLALVISFALTGLSTIVVGLRFYSRYFLVKKLSSPDWVMLVALICTWGCAVVNYYQVHFLDYTHAWDSREAFAEIIQGGLLSWWIYRIFYLVDHCLIKVSILLFYIYVASSRKSFHWIVKGIMAFIVLGSVGMVIAAIFSCVPPSDAWSFDVFWNGFYGIHPDQCYNPIYLWYFSASFNLFTDTVIWILPPLFLMNLQSMHGRRRLELIGIFSVGIMAVVASAIRLWVLVLWTSGFIKQGENTGNLIIWGQVEQHAGIIAASIPFLRPLYRKVFGSCSKRQQPSPGPAAKLIQPHLTPEGNPMAQRTPIIPSPSPTFGSSSEPFKVPQSPLSPISPISPIRPELPVRITV
ncbi:hypothetical protein CC78DRAFT_301265 [Lojkania enalia]|uniref:Rhodopsin domain-containing protein n=1 Tax=Lojkania enalia TaxID=147567 RepID=A0A9P4K7M6_9PLEO|nr:hypothetical protein CC78DRAFT_301265 [Didymosphaeria enalia]